MDHDLGVYWHVSFRCEHIPGLFRDESPRLIEALRKTPFWRELQVMALWSNKDDRIGKAKPLDTATAIKKLLKAGKSVHLARGALDVFEQGTAEVDITITPNESGLAVRAHVRGEALTRLGVAVLDGWAEMLTDLVALWRKHGVRMSEAWARPTGGSTPFTYPRLKPPRLTKPFRERSAVIDVLDTLLPHSEKFPDTAPATRHLAEAEVPKGVVRREREGVVTLRWVANPGEREALARAAAAHERWLYGLLPSEVERPWSESGELKLIGHPRPAVPGLDLLTLWQGEHFGHVVAGTAIPAPPPRTLADGTPLKELRLIASSRDAAIALSEKGREAGYDRVAYRDEQGELWDPVPPGPWAT